jgi:hypothetical protein
MVKEIMTAAGVPESEEQAQLRRARVVNESFTQVMDERKTNKIKNAEQRGGVGAIDAAREQILMQEAHQEARSATREDVSIDREKIIQEASEQAKDEVRKNPAKKRRLEFGEKVLRLLREAEGALGMEKDGEPKQEAPEK